MVKNQPLPASLRILATFRLFSASPVNLLRKLEQLPTSVQGGAVAIGNFDGVHQGHVRIIQHLQQAAREVGGPAVVFTFEPHPARLLRPEAAPPPLTWADRKADLLAELGVDAMIACPTDRALLERTYREFFDDVIRGKLQARALVEGPNFYFGKDREGTPEHLRQLCAQYQIPLTIVEPLLAEGAMVSSSRVRSAIREGQVELAARLLTHAYRIRGMVTHGSARGAQLGFPTANLAGIDTLVPAPGVYAGRALIQQRLHWSAIHIGPNPTFGEALPKVEVHVLDWEESLYGQVLEVEFIGRLRNVSAFASRNELIAQLERDVAAVRSAARELVPPTPAE